ncbi:hypothetical protein [Chrysiogenes arsenatis]|uniref:hypothetical protein n=1 Tax=Chrysiogenes arsenatis TaxID=309797 RepID=UPI000410198E|nr:hypothetical protein [Chrysiogenes arsenatis]
MNPKHFIDLLPEHEQNALAALSERLADLECVQYATLYGGRMEDGESPLNVIFLVPERTEAALAQITTLLDAIEAEYTCHIKPDIFAVVPFLTLLEQRPSWLKNFEQDGIVLFRR